MRRTKIKNIYLALIVLAAQFTFPSGAVHACALSMGDPWFSTKTQITNPLSDVIDIQASNNSEILTFTNKELDSDFYIGSKDIDGKYPGGFVKAHQSYIPLVAIFGKDYEPNVLVRVRSGVPQGVSFFKGGWNESIDGNANSGKIPINSVLDSTDNYKSKQSFSSSKRPDNVVVPTDDHQTMYAFYKDQIYEIGVDIQYSLNPNHKPTVNECPDESAFIGPKAKKNEAINDRITTNVPAVLIPSVGILLGLVAAAVIDYVRYKKK